MISCMSMLLTLLVTVVAMKCNNKSIFKLKKLKLIFPTCHLPTCSVKVYKIGPRSKTGLFFQLDASLMSCLLCLVTVSVFLHVNFLVKLLTMLLAGTLHLTIYTCFLAEAPVFLNATSEENIILGHGG